MKYVVILGRKIPIVYKKFDNSDFGEFDPDAHVIYINTDKAEDGYHSTLIHEIVHAALRIAGWDGILKTKEEPLVQMLENALAPVVMGIRVEDEK